MFTYILYGFAAVGLAVSFHKDRNKTKMALRKAWKAFAPMPPHKA